MSEKKKSWVSTQVIAEALEVSLPTARKLLDYYAVPVNKNFHGWRIKRSVAERFIKKMSGSNE